MYTVHVLMHCYYFKGLLFKRVDHTQPSAPVQNSIPNTRLLKEFVGERNREKYENSNH